MAIFNEILVGRFNRSLQKLLSMKGGPPARALGGEIVPIIQFDQLADFWYLSSQGMFAIQLFVAAGGAGNITSIQLRNPAGSNVVGNIVKITLQGQASTDSPFLKLGPVAADLATNNTASITALDPRGQGNSAFQLSSKNNTAVQPGPANQMYQSGLLALSQVDVLLHRHHALPLLPGNAIVYSTPTTNVALNITLWWLERALEDSERA